MALRFGTSQVIIASVGSALAVSALAFAAVEGKSLMLLGSFGASALMLFYVPDGHLSQPRAVVGGHLLACLIALAGLTALGPQWWAMGLTTGVAIAGMMLTRTLHPPAASNAIIVFLAKPSPLLLLSSALAGAAGLVMVAMVYHRVVGRHKYPVYWHQAPAA